MNDFLQIIGSAASLISIPLAIYIFLKSKESTFSNLKKDIVRILSYQIGDGRKLTSFEIDTVIKSKLREKKIKEGSIIGNEIVEDLVLEIISSPLINKQDKGKIIEELKHIYTLPKNLTKGEKEKSELVVKGSENHKYSQNISSIYAGAATFGVLLVVSGGQLIESILGSPFFEIAENMYRPLLPLYGSMLAAMTSILIFKIILRKKEIEEARERLKQFERLQKRLKEINQSK